MIGYDNGIQDNVTVLGSKLYSTVNELLRQLILALTLHRSLDSFGVSWRFSMFHGDFP